jgi:hypothetical protein
VLHPRFPVVSDDVDVGDRWRVTIPGEVNRRDDAGDLVLWRPGLTVRCAVNSVSEGGDPQSRLASARRVSGVRSPLVERADGLVTVVAGLVRAGDDEGPAIYSGVAVAADTALVVMVHADGRADDDAARLVVESVRLREG